MRKNARKYLTTKAEIDEARAMRKNGSTLAFIAKKYGTSVQNIWHIVNFPTKEELDNEVILHTRKCIELHDKYGLTWIETARRMGVDRNVLCKRRKTFANRPLFQ